MEIRNDSNPGGPDRRKLQELRSESIRASRDALKGSQESVRLAAEAHARSVQAHTGTVRQHREAAVDRLDLSASGQVLAEAGTDPARLERVRELKALYEAGRLNTPERLEQAAARMLERP